MDKKEFEAYIKTDRRISAFCNNVMLKLENEYEGFLEGTNCCLEDITFTDSDIYVDYSYEIEDEEELGMSTFIITIDQLLREDVDACAKELADEIYSSGEDMFVPNDSMN